MNELLAATVRDPARRMLLLDPLHQALRALRALTPPTGPAGGNQPDRAGEEGS